MRKKRVSLATMSRENKLIVYCFGVLSDLKRKGFVISLPWEISPLGQHLYNEMIEFEYEPTDDEVRWGMNQIMLAAKAADEDTSSELKEDGEITDKEDEEGEEWKLGTK